MKGDSSAEIGKRIYELKPHLKYVPNKLDSSEYAGRTIYRREIVQDAKAAATRSGGAASAPGLSKVHNRPESERWSFRFYGDGSLCELKAPSRLEGVPPECSTRRGKVTSFSPASRRRMLKTVGRLKQTAMPVFVTLTYPDEFPFDMETWRNHLAALWRRVRRRWPEAAAIWKKEFKRRKSGTNEGKVAPHFHMLLWGAEINNREPYDWFRHWKFHLARDMADGKKLLLTEHYLHGIQPDIKQMGPNVKVCKSVRMTKRGTRTTVQYWEEDGVPHLTDWARKLAQRNEGVETDRDVIEELRAWFSLAWAEIVRSGDPRHIVAGTRVEKVESVRGVFAYASKYLGKIEDDPVADSGSIGRCWGVLGRENLPWAEIEELELEPEVAILLRRAAIRYLTAERRKRGAGGRYKCRSRGMFWFSGSPREWLRLASEPVEPF